jgi:hypothetical protein
MSLFLKNAALGLIWVGRRCNKTIEKNILRLFVIVDWKNKFYLGLYSLNNFYQNQRYEEKVV